MTASARILGALRARVDALLRHRDSLPGPVNRLIDHVADNPTGFLGRIAARSLGEVRPEDLPAPTQAPAESIRVYIAPTNYAQQGWEWARALDAIPGVGAKNMAVDVPGGFDFRADTTVPVPVHASSELWQSSEFSAVTRFTHVLIEAERALFGGLFGRDVNREVAALSAAGVSVAFLAHGTDVRLPSRHRESTVWSPYADGGYAVERQERQAARNIAILEGSSRPVFVSTPDLLTDLPTAMWCPVVVVPERWAAARVGGAAEPVRVAHVPSKSAVKGTPLIEPVLSGLVDSGVISYQPVAGVPSADMPRRYGSADIVLDQFRLGSYGVAACEAMAAGCVVVGHVIPSVRSHVRAATGRDLPIVEATPETLGSVLIALADDPAQRAVLGDAGRSFVREVHDGRRSAAALLEGWIRR